MFGISPGVIEGMMMRELGSGVGVAIGVLPNDVNVLAQELKEKEMSLNELEALLKQKESGISQATFEEQNKAFWVIGIIGGALLSLIVLNFYLDWRRRRQS
ncbi:MAG: hypothetical protein UX72_C0028G0005 [Parcubacteria group bacterium GW2011_GWA2_47_10]|nr:MAG: hypothetical protein UX72_C0028G0005 [Parcubacteria group bacterium GW2011_GWA2_47_10]